MLRIALFISIYLAIYGGMHYYLYRRLRLGFELTRRARVAVSGFLLLMVFGPMLSRMLERLEWSGMAESAALLVYGWMGLLFLSASLFFFVDIVRVIAWLLRRVAKLSLPGMIVGWRPLFIGVFTFSVLASIYGFYAAREIRVERVTLATSKLPAGVERYRMVQLSDLHLGVMTDQAWLQRIVDTVAALKPDLLVATGDIIDSNVASALPYQSLLSTLLAVDGQYAVAGNHEFFAGIDKSVSYMQEAGFVMLRGERAVVNPWLHILGVDDREGRHMGAMEVDHEAPLMAANDPSVISVLLKHQPVIREEHIGQFDLQLAGHVHQGQIFPFRLLTWMAYPIAMGLSDLGQGSQIYVARGTGTWGPPIRLLAPPEITLFEFVRDN